MPADTDHRRDGRVRAVHAQARPTVALALVFAAAAPVAAALPHDTRSWLPLHLLLAGAVVLAISATTQLFAVTWSAAPAPPEGWVRAQRVLLAAGVAGLAAGRELDWPTAAVALAGSSVLASLVVLGVLLEVTRRGGTQRRFDVAVRHYEVAVGFGVIGCGLGIAMVAGGDGLRSAHLAANLLGLVGSVVLGTLPWFVATTARMKTNPRLEAGARVPLVAGTAAVGVAVVGLAADVPAVAAAGLAGWVAALAATVRLLPRPGAKQLRWAGPRLVAVACSLLWSAGAVGVAAWRATDGADPWSPAVLGALAVGGVAQLVWSALCYLVPVLRGGGHEVLTRSFAATRSPLALVALNVTAALLVAGRAGAAAAVAGVVVVDTAVRFGRVRFGAAAPAPSAGTGSPPAG